MMIKRNEEIGEWGLQSHPLTRIWWQMVLIALSIIAVFPVLWMFLTAVKPNQEIFQREFKLLPSTFTLEHFSHLLNHFPLGQIVFNTLFVALGMTAIQLLTSIFAAYGFARYQFPFRNATFYCCLATMFIPVQIIMVPNYLYLTELGLNDTRIGVIIPQMATAFGIFLLRQHLLLFPQSIIEAARMDGYGELRILFKVVLPNITPAIYALAIILFIDSWNQYVWPSIILSSPENMTIPIWLKQFMHAEAGTNWGLLMSASSIGVLPVLIVYFFAHKKIMNSFTSSGVKG